MQEGSRRERSEDATLLALMKEKEAISEGMQAISKGWKRQRNGFSPRTSRRHTGLLTHFGFLISRTVR